MEAALTHLPRLDGTHVHHQMAVLLVGVVVVEDEEGVGDKLSGHYFARVSPHHVELCLKERRREGQQIGLCHATCIKGAIY